MSKIEIDPFLSGRDRWVVVGSEFVMDKCARGPWRCIGSPDMTAELPG